MLRQIDIAIFRVVNGDLHAPWLDPFFLFITDPPLRIALFALLWGLLFVLGGRQGRVAAFTVLLAVAAADQIGAGLIKPWIDGVRPCFALPEARLLLPNQARSPSFPSNHAANTFAAAVVLFQVRRWLGAAGLVLAGLIAWSRMYVGVHYPSDVVAGAALGMVIGALGVHAQRSLSKLRPLVSISRRGGPGSAQGERRNCR